MAQRSRQNDQHLQSLHNFYESLVLLYILGPCVGPRIQSQGRLSTSTEPVYSPLRIFIDRLCWVCDYEPGGGTVSAIALEQTIRGITFWLATSYKAVQKESKHLEFILNGLQSAHTLSAGPLHQLEQEICTRCIGIAGKRVSHYADLFCKAVKECQIMLRKSDPLLYRDLMSLANLAGSPMELCASADQFRDSESLKRLSVWVSATKSPSEWSHLRHYIGRLGSWHRASRTLVGFARGNPQIFRVIEIKALFTPKPIHAPLMDELSNLSSALFRMYTVEKRNYLMQGIEALQRLRHLDLDKKFQDEYGDRNFKPRVHAEAWLLEHFYNNAFTFVNNDKYIGCSKPSCYCCNLYFQNHPGGFAQRPSHGNVWTNWQSPLHQDKENQERDASIRSAMTIRMRGDLEAQIGRSNADQHRLPDSTTGLTLSDI